MAGKARSPIEAAHATARALVTQLSKIRSSGPEAVELLEATRAAERAAARLGVVVADRRRSDG